jgi:serine/threonine protein kinase
MTPSNSSFCNLTIVRVKIDSDCTIEMISDISSGMEYLHKLSMVHRDLKSLNVLVREDWTLLIADFGKVVQY